MIAADNRIQRAQPNSLKNSFFTRLSVRGYEPEAAPRSLSVEGRHICQGMPFFLGRYHFITESEMDKGIINDVEVFSLGAMREQRGASFRISVSRKRNALETRSIHHRHRAGTFRLWYREDVDALMQALEQIAPTILRGTELHCIRHS